MKDPNPNMGWKILGFAALGGLFCAFFLGGCAGAKIKDAQVQLLNEVADIVQKSDCPTACEALKLYIRNRLGK